MQLIITSLLMTFLLSCASPSTEENRSNSANDAGGSATVNGEVEEEDTDLFETEIDVSDWSTTQSQKTTGTNLQAANSAGLKTSANSVQIFKLGKDPNGQHAFLPDEEKPLSADKTFKFTVLANTYYVIKYKTLSAMVPALADNTVLPLILNSQSSIAVNLFLRMMAFEKGQSLAEKKSLNTDLINQLSNVVESVDSSDTLQNIIDSLVDETITQNDIIATSTDGAAINSAVEKIVEKAAESGKLSEDTKEKLKKAEETTSQSDTTTQESNSPPIANAGADSTVEAKQLVGLSANGSSDPDGDNLAYQWSQESGTTVSLANGNSASASFTSPNAGTTEDLIFTLTVTDSGGLTHTDQVTISVAASKQPVVDAGADKSETEGTNITLSGASCSDPEGEANLTYLWEQQSGTSASLSSNSAINPNFNAPNVVADDDLVFKLTCTDPQGLSGEDTITVSVTNVPKAWGTAEDIDNLGGPVSDFRPSLATNSTGSLAVAWLQNETNQSPQYTTYDGTNWATPYSFSGQCAIANCGPPSIAIDSQDRYVIGFESQQNLLIGYYNAGHQITPKSHLATITANTVRVAIDDSTGNAMALFIGDSDKDALYATFTRSNNTVSAIDVVETNATPMLTHAPALVSLGDDDFRAFYTTIVASYFDTFYNDFNGTTWDSSTGISLGKLGNPSVSNNAGKMHILGTNDENTNSDSRYFDGTTWQPVKAHTSGDSSDGYIAQCANGEAWAINHSISGSAYKVTNFTPATNSWAAEITLVFSITDTDTPRIVVDSTCTPTIFYRDKDSTTYYDYFAMHYDGTNWGSAINLTDSDNYLSGGDANQLEVAVTSDDKIIAVWRQIGGSVVNLRARIFE